MKKATDASPNHALKRERAVRCLSQVEVADRIGTTALNVSRWERGITFPSTYFRQQLCLVFEKTPQELGFLADDSENKAPVQIVDMTMPHNYVLFFSFLASPILPLTEQTIPEKKGAKVTRTTIIDLTRRRIKDNNKEASHMTIKQGSLYTIQLSDTLQSIAQQAYGEALAIVGQTAISQANCITSLPPSGSSLLIPLLMSSPQIDTFYTVESGDTLQSIATQAYGEALATVGQTAISQANNDPELVTAVVVFIPPLVSSPQVDTFYTVKTGDTLWNIATQAYGGNLAIVGQTAISQANNITSLPPSRSVVFIPSLVSSPQIDAFYIVAAGDTLLSVAGQAYGEDLVTVGQMAISQANGNITALPSCGSIVFIPPLLNDTSLGELPQGLVAHDL